MNEEPSMQEILAAKPEPPRRRAVDAPPLRLLPASTDAEQAIVCSFLLAPREVGSMCEERELSPSLFHSPALGAIYRELRSMRDALMPVDVVTLTQHLADCGILETVGGAAYVSQLFTFLPTASNASYYLDIIEDKALLRQTISVCTEFESRSYDEQDNPTLIAELHERVTALTLRGVREEKTFREILAQSPERWQGYAGAEGSQLYTGFARLDAISAIRRKHTVVISGREKSGKSALAGGIVLNAAHRERIPSLVFSLEMPSEEWVDRLLSEHGSLSQRGIQSGTLTAEEMDRACAAITDLSSAPIDIYDSLLALPRIVAKMRQWKARHASGALCVIDYLQLVDAGFVKGRNREQEVAMMSKTLRNVGKELDIALIELCQLNSAGEARESRSIQQDCTAFWQVLEDTDENGQVKRGREKYRTLHVKFQRHGERNKRIPFTFLGDWMRFREEEEADTPELFEDRPKRRSTQHPDD